MFERLGIWLRDKLSDRYPKPDEWTFHYYEGPPPPHLDPLIDEPSLNTGIVFHDCEPPEGFHQDDSPTTDNGTDKVEPPTQPKETQ